MILIAHRGNIEGPNRKLENQPEYINQSLEKNYDAEIDLWLLDNGQFYLGHDDPDYSIDIKWILQRKNRLWVHCKNLRALHYLTERDEQVRYFWHHEDDYTLTSNRLIWAYPGKPCTNLTILAMPEYAGDIDFNALASKDYYGVCTDFVGSLQLVLHP